MLETIIAALAPREEAIEFAGKKLIVREMQMDAEVTAFTDPADMQLKLLVRSVRDETGNLVFQDEDIPKLNGSGRSKLMPLVQAAMRVNGFDASDNEKNSDAAPA